MPKMRLDKLFSETGLLSCSECRKTMQAGRITVNGVPAGAPERKIAFLRPSEP